MKKKILLICLLILSTNVFAQSSLSLREQIANRERMRNIKKTYGYKDIKIMEIGGFYCYAISQKINGAVKYGVMDRDFNIVFPCEYDDFGITPAYKSGYSTFPVIAFNGQQDYVQLYCYSSPITLHLEKGNKTFFFNTNFEPISEFGSGTLIFGNWVFTGVFDRRQVYVKEYNGIRKLTVTQYSENNSVGMYKLDGTEIIKYDHNWFNINDHSNGNVNYANTFTKAGVGGFILEDLSYKIPSTCVTVKFMTDKNIFLVKTSPTDVEHIFDPSENIVVTTKNRGEELYREGKHKEALEYFSTEGVSDPDSKIYSAFCLMKIERDITSLMNQYLQDMSHRSKPKVYNYEELKEMLETSRMLLESCKQQDPSRTEICDDNLKWVDLELGKLESTQAEVKYNSFGNQLLRALAEGVVRGIASGLTQSSEKSSAASSSTSKSSNSSASGSTTSNSGQSRSSRDSNRDDNSKKTVTYRECHKCRGTGDIFTTSTISTYGNDTKKICPKCGKEHWSSTVHHHQKCTNCNGTGKVAE